MERKQRVKLKLETIRNTFSLNELVSVFLQDTGRISDCHMYTLNIKLLFLYELAVLDSGGLVVEDLQESIKWMIKELKLRYYKSNESVVNGLHRRLKDHVAKAHGKLKKGAKAP